MPSVPPERKRIIEMKKKPGIRTKLILVVIPVVLALIVCFFLISRSLIVEQARENLKAASNVYAEDINGWVERILGELKVYQDAINKGPLEDDREILELMETSMEVNEAYPVGLYMGDDSGVYLDASGWVPDADWVLTQRDWYLEGCEHQELAFGEPYYDSQTGQVCVSASVRMDYDRAVRVMAVDVYLDYVADMMKEIRLYDSGRAFLVTGSQMVIAHPEESMMETRLDQQGLDILYKNISDRLSQGVTGLTTVQGDDGSYLIYISPIARTDWRLVTFIAESEVLRDLRLLELYMLIIAVAAAAVLLILILRMMNRIVKPVRTVTDTLAEVAAGDFTRELEVKGRDELAQMSGNMQMFLRKMRNIIAEITGTAKWLSQQSQENGVVAGTLTQSAGHQKKAMEEMNALVDTLSETVDSFSRQMELLVTDVRTTYREGTNAGDIMQNAATVSHSGQQAMDQIRQGMEMIEQTIASLEDQIRHTHDTIGRINEMVGMIMDISEETNLLALNASIEAARAGEAGKGFAVVAEQIGKLAANSNAAADDISRLTQDISQAVSKAVSHTEISVGKVKESAAMIETTSQTFDGVFAQVEEAGGIVAHMVELIGQVDQAASRMAGQMESQLQVSRDISEAAAELGEHAQVVARQSEKAAESAGELEKQSGKLMTDMGQFKI